VYSVYYTKNIVKIKIQPDNASGLAGGGHLAVFVWVPNLRGFTATSKLPKGGSTAGISSTYSQMNKLRAMVSATWGVERGVEHPFFT
jgi:hypothetical protein